jgi:thiol-disulfide isomerase/thioredoxin
MRYLLARLFAASLTLGSSVPYAQTPAPQNSANQSTSPAASPTHATAPAPPPAVAGAAEQNSSASADPEKELEKEVNDANNDYAKVAHNLQEYLKRFPSPPRKAAVYKALVQSCQQIRDDACVLEYSEKLIAIQPEDAQTLMAAVGLLQQRGDPESLARAKGYVSAVIEGVQKLSPDRRPERLSVADWKNQHDKLLMALFNVRGDIEHTQKSDDDAAKDYQSSFSTIPNPAAAKALGDIAESRRDWTAAADQYLLALVLPDAGPVKVDRAGVLVRLKSAWQQGHGNTQGLGDELLAAYGRVPPLLDATNVGGRPNKDAKNVFDFVLRQVDGTPLPLAPLKGKVVVLSFWATWCSPCFILEPILGNMAKKYSANTNIAFLGVNSDEDESLVPPFLAGVKWILPVAYSDGLKEYFGVDAFPTVIILDHDGKTVFRVEGFPEQGYVDELTAAINSAAGPPKTASGS